VAQFVRTGWRPWARVVVRRRADDFAAATTALDNTTRDKVTAERSLGTAQSEVDSAERELFRSRRDKQDRDTELRELLDSRPYQDAVAAAERVEGLRRTVSGLVQQRQTAQRRLDREQAAVDDARGQAGQARQAADRAEQDARTAAEALRAAAEPAGLADSCDRHLPGRDVDGLAADYAGRAERFAQLRILHAEHDRAAQQAERSALAVQGAERALATAREEEGQARTAVERQVDALREQIRDWAAAARVARCPDRLTEQWCDQVSELTAIEAETGTVQPGA
jgi:hypothetical protein